MSTKSRDDVAVIIPTYQGARSLPELLASLRGQSLAPAEILVVDSSSTDGSPEIARAAGATVHVIPKAEFGHGTTRNLAARRTTAGIMIFLTQDALPCDSTFVAELTRPLRAGEAAAANARQVPYLTASAAEAFARTFNYPAESRVRTLADLPRLGIKTFFFSNVASAVRRAEFEAVGGFPEGVILNEDMLLCARLVRAGHAVAYCAEARVFHSHDFTLRQQFARYFDIGASITAAGPLLEGAHANGEGLRFVLELERHLVAAGEYSAVPRTLAESALKMVGFQLGKRERLLPRALKRKLSLHSYHWK
jgi:rhamnosyltransferase